LAVSKDEQSRINAAYQLLFGRPATAGEQQDATTFFKEYAVAVADRPEAERPLLMWQAYSRVLLSSSEVLHVD
jgi:hypothetical protein